MKTVKDILLEEKAVSLMTPMGYVQLSVEQVKEVLKNEEVEANPGCRGYNMPISVKELLQYKVIRGAYNAKTEINEYLVDSK